MDKAKIIGIWALVYAVATFITILILNDVDKLAPPHPTPVVSSGTK